MTSRASFYRSKSKHAQRSFGEVKKTLQPKGTDTAWITEFISSIQGLTGSFGIDSTIAMQLGATPEERMVKLRQACRLVVLHMTVVRDEAGAFVEYRWTLTPEATR